MRLAAVAKARCLAFIELDELNVEGKIRFSDCVSAIVERYGFERFPKKPEDYDLDKKGAKFESGKAGDLTIDSLTVFNGVLFVDTFASTDDSRHILIEMLEWGRDDLGLTYREGMIRRWGYISDLVFYTDFPFLENISAPLKRLAAKTSEITQNLFNGLTYSPMLVTVGHDPTARKFGVAGFTIQHRVNSAFTENKYFSEAPLPTDIHIRLLEELEAEVLETMGRR